MDSDELVSNILSLFAVALSAISLLISIRTERTHNTIRLQFGDGSMSYSTSDPIFVFEHALQNAGESPVEISDVWMHVGDATSEVRRYQYHLAGSRHLRSGEQIPLAFRFTRQQFAEIRDEVGFRNDERCTFSLQVDYVDSNGRARSVRRTIGGLTADGDPILIIGLGDVLT